MQKEILSLSLLCRRNLCYLSTCGFHLERSISQKKIRLIDNFTKGFHSVYNKEKHSYDSYFYRKKSFTHQYFRRNTNMLSEHYQNKLNKRKTSLDWTLLNLFSSLYHCGLDPPLPPLLSSLMYFSPGLATR